MGIVTSYIWGDAGRTDDPDPVTGLTSWQRCVLKRTWKRVSDGPACLETGMAIFINLFEKNPQYHQLFPFRDIPKDQLTANEKFRAHCISLMYAFSSIMDNVDAPPMMEQLFIKQAINHVPRNVPHQAYWDLKEVLLKLFAKKLTDDEVKTWEKFLDLGIGIMVKNTAELTKS